MQYMDAQMQVFRIIPVFPLLLVDVLEVQGGMDPADHQALRGVCFKITITEATCPFVQSVCIDCQWTAWCYHHDGLAATSRKTPGIIILAASAKPGAALSGCDGKVE